MAFQDSVFINCPFDDGYKPLLRAMLFFFIRSGIQPHLSVNRSTSDNRIQEIGNLIGACKYGVHDLSRMVSEKVGEVARFNMPFEFGIDWGCSKFGSKQQQTKVLLLLDEKRYRYIQALSDIGGYDMRVHDADPETLIQELRTFYYNHLPQLRNLQGSVIWQDYNAFLTDLKQIIPHDGDRNRIEVTEWIDLIQGYLNRK